MDNQDKSSTTTFTNTPSNTVEFIIEERDGLLLSESSEFILAENGDVISCESENTLINQSKS